MIKQSIYQVVLFCLRNKMKTKIIAYSVGRSDIDRYSPILNYLHNHNSINLKVVGSYLHYLSIFGETFTYLKKFNLIKRNLKKQNIDDPNLIASNLGNEIKILSKIFKKENPHIVVVLGDRYEMIAAPLAAIPFNIPLVHFYGGSLTFGAIDEQIRHAITKMCHLHFTAHEDYSKRIIKMGEEKWRVNTIGIINLKDLKSQKIYTNNQIRKKLGLDLKNKTLLVTLHPTTLDNMNLKKNLITLLKSIKDTKFQAIFTYPNSDYGYKTIIKLVQKFCRSSKKFIFLKNSSIDLYPSLMKKCYAMIGNSSSGIVESGTFQLPVINIGSRQDGKVMGNNVINCNFDYNEIMKAFDLIASKKFKKSLKKFKNPYEKNFSLKKIKDLILNCKNNKKILNKKFID